ncbi:PRC-barrel domain-containing protein [Defluviimonas sp. WL0024]|uniref:PRC-barrel domain-containing protein n=1 Tax=Albidovulum salinarum TaxID=2984153 RepID=A0ABT2X8F5_9RHOB|nr:PRC-barrel domain-containing protein [Defluviimonas sp. WL0024]MCU9850229.1 PRC-barrel domain-containing protein [Defluviimonas sp. WL0024]
MKKLLISTALVAATTAASYAQEATFRLEADPMEIHASEFIGQRVYSSENALDGDAFDGIQDGWEDVGEVNDVILSRDGAVEAVLVDIGGFLGIGERQVAVDMDALRFVADGSTADNEADYFLVMQAGRAHFEEAPEYSWTRGAMEKVVGEAEQAAEATGEAVGDAAEATAETVENTAEATADAASDTLAAVGVAADEVAGAEREHVMRDGYEPAADADMNTEMLTGAPAYDANDEWIGEISELIINTDGEITHGIIDVGGFLGIGEKPVELEIAQIDILRQSDGGDLRVYVPLTKEEMEALPTYNK